jgi:hypothetical protein
MPIVTCPSCRRRYDAGIDEDPATLPDNLSMKVVCPACGQWVRLPEVEPVDPPNVPGHVLSAMMGQSRLLDEPAAASSTTEPEPDRARERDADRPCRRAPDEEEDRPRRRAPADDEDADFDRPRRRRFEDDEDDGPRRRRREYADEDDPHWGRGSVYEDYDDYPRRRSSADGLGITSMILGIVSCVIALTGFCCVLMTGLSILAGITGLILGFVARSQRPDSGMAKAGIILGFAGLGISVIMIVLVVVLQIAMAATP